MHSKRWITGLIAIPLLILIIGLGPRWRWPFYALLYAASVVGLVEFYRLTAPDLPKPVRWSSYGLTLLLFLALSFRQILMAFPIMALWAFVPMTFFMLRHPSPDPRWTSSLSASVLGTIYVVIPLALLVLIDFLPNGNIWIFYLLIVIFGTDTGAFYFGKSFGRHKLYEAISPKKTWEGAIGGLLTAVVLGSVFLKVSGLLPLTIEALFLSICLSSIGQIGDLAESMLKRNHGAKDSGLILPGHGGLLDRIDGLIFSVPALYAYLFFTLL